VKVACTETSEAGGVKPEEKSQKKDIFSRFVSASMQSVPNRSDDNQYFAQPVLPDADPAVYWSSAQNEFPNMATLARRYTYVRYNYYSIKNNACKAAFTLYSCWSCLMVPCFLLHCVFIFLHPVVSLA